MELTIETVKRIQAVNLTEQILGAVKEKSGKLVHIYTPHTTCGLIINEQADPDVIDDITKALDRMAPADYPYRHLEGNSDAHIKSVLTGSSVSIPFSQGRLMLGTWQGIFFMEFDGPRTRKVIVTIV